MKLIEEPVEEWNNLNLLKLFYEHKDRWSFTFEHFVQLSRLRAHITSLNEIKKNPNKIVIMERSLWSSHHVFAKNTFEEKGIQKIEYDILESYHKMFSEKLIKDSGSSLMLPFHVIYVRTDPRVCFERLKIRCREAENKISLEYLMKIHDKYENWIENIVYKNKSFVSIIDGNVQKFEVSQNIENIIVNNEDDEEIKIKSILNKI
jgi:thymidine kinase